MSIASARGTKDLFGEEIDKFNEIIETLKNIVGKYGFKEIKTPTFEEVALFKPDIDKTLLPNKELFLLEGGRYVLRPENTASIVRAVVQHKLLSTAPTPLNFFYCAPCFRYERPQAGRFREFWQFGVEVIGGKSVYDDLEIILLVNEIIKSFKLPLTFCLNYLGNVEVKRAWSQELSKYFRENSTDLSELSISRIDKNPLRILDDSHDREKEVVKNAPPLSNYLSTSDFEIIESLKSFLSALNIDFLWEPTLVRGIDYYTGFVYEWKYKDLTVIAGGRYDDFFNRFIDKEVPSLGFAIGVERLKNCLEEIGYEWKYEDVNCVYFAHFTTIEPSIFTFLNSLRSQGITIRTSWEKNRLKDHFKISERFGAQIILLFGDNERKEEKIILKYGAKNIQKTFSLKDIEGIVSEIRTLETWR